jgi:phosphatidate cytidylyltransferase
MNRVTPLFQPGTAFDHLAMLVIPLAAGGVLLFAAILIPVLHRSGRIGDKLYAELVSRCVTWAVLIPLILLPVLAGAGAVIAAVFLLSLVSYREYSRATGIFRQRIESITVVMGIGLIAVAATLQDRGLFIAAGVLMTLLIPVAGLLTDEPKGYIQRVALGALGFLLFGICLGHLGLLANEPDFRPLLLWLILCVELNDVFAYVTGKLFGRRKLCPNTSPNKTIAGCVGAIILTTGSAAVVGHFVFSGGPLDRPLVLLGLGLVVGISGQLGDLVISSMKRDIGIKDMGRALPGHGGFLDRFDSLLLAAPTVFYFIHWVQGSVVEGGAEIVRNIP